MNRRNFLALSAGLTAALASASVYSVRRFDNGGRLHLLSDGHLDVKGTGLSPGVAADEFMRFATKTGLLNQGRYQPPCNLTLWENGTTKVLFDVGAGPNFMPSTGKLLDSLQQIGVDPLSITHVAFTHAHPDHIWGLLDDFDELICPNAAYFVANAEWDFWMNPRTIEQMPENRKLFAAGAKNYLQHLGDHAIRFDFDSEIIPGVQAINTQGHTPGHSAFAIDVGGESITVIGDALLNEHLSFAKPMWQSSADHDPEQAIATRKTLLASLAKHQSQIVGYHLQGGLGRVDSDGDAYRFLPTSM